MTDDHLGAMDELMARRDRRLGTVLRFVIPASIAGALSTIPGLFLDPVIARTSMISGVSLLVLGSLYGVSYAFYRRGNGAAARWVLFGAWLAYALEQLLLFRPDFNDPVLGTLYVSIATAFTAMIIVGVTALDAWHRAWRWVLTYLLIYAATGVLITVVYLDQWASLHTWLTTLGISALLLVCVAGFAWAFTTDLHEVLRGSEDQRRRESDLRAQLEVALEAAHSASAAKSQFLANMSHELRTPLAGIVGYAELIEEEVVEAGRSDIVGDLHKISGAAKHLRQIIDDILDLSKIEAGRLDILKERVRVPALIAEIEAAAKPLVRAGVTLEVRVDNTTWLNTDSVRLKQVLLNLLSNACKFTESGAVRLHVDGRTPGAVQFAVSDTGIGIQPEQLARVFRPFEQADGSTTRRFGGTGLGLAISARLVELLGGHLDATSEPGRGSVFSFALPAAAPSASMSESSVAR